MAVRVGHTRSPPDGKSPSPQTADASVVIPGFLSRSRQVNMAVPLPAPVLLSRLSPQTCASPHNLHKTENPERHGRRSDNFPNTMETIPNWRRTVSLANPDLIQGSSFKYKPSTDISGVCRPQPAPRLSLSASRGPPPSPAPRSSSLSHRAHGTILRLQSTPVTSESQPSGRPRPVSVPVPSAIHKSVSRPIQSSVRSLRAIQHASRAHGETAATSDADHNPKQHLASQSHRRVTASISATNASQPSSVTSPDTINQPRSRSSALIDPYFIQPLNLCDPFVDNLGLAEICSLQVDRLQYLTHTNHNKPVVTPDGRTLPSFLVRIWSRGSGKYLDILTVGELYGRGHFGHTEPFRLVLVGPRVVMLQSARDTRLYVSLRNGAANAKGRGGRESELLIHQGPTGYCLLESLHWPGSFLGVRNNGNIIRPASVDVISDEARFVIQKESLAAL